MNSQHDAVKNAIQMSAAIAIVRRRSKRDNRDIFV
jgi:hypothetical protein